jgi:hypothetical protein
MSYTEGKLLGKEEAFKGCENDGENYCVKDASEITMTNVSCLD